jgi:multiple sugar transport system ATP-binding protein
MRAEISKLHKRLGTTFVYVTHDQVEAMTMADRIVVMKDGLIQQVDTPQNLYENPCNTFVAGFIGAPQMNFIDAVVVKTKDGFAAKFGEVYLPAPAGRIRPDTISTYENKEVIVGIRPECLHVEQSFMEMDSACVMDVKVDLAELMGSEVFLYVLCEGVSLIAKIPSRLRPGEGQALKLALDCDQLHLFDKQTGVVLK